MALAPDQALLLTVLLNSVPSRVYIASCAPRLRGAYYDHLSWVLGLVPLPEKIRCCLEDGTASTELERLLEISQTLHENPQRSDRPALESELDSIVARLYSLTGDQLEALREFYVFITPSHVTAEVSDLEEDETSEVDE